MADFAPDPEQELILDAIFGFDRAGKSVAFEVCVICARQNLKTGAFKQAALGYLFLTDQRLIVWSAHEFPTAQEAFRDLSALVTNCDMLRKRVKRIYAGNGDESIELLNGQRLIFRARTKRGGRGLSGSKVFLDEAFALKPEHMGALVPTLSVQPDPQVIYGSSAGLVDSDVLREIRDRGRVGGSSLAYIEWCAPKGGCVERFCTHAKTAEGCALDDPVNLQAANPLMGKLRANGTGLTLEYLRDERQTIPPMEFARERLGWWDEPDSLEAVFGPGAWAACAVEPTKVPKRGIVLGLAVSLHREWSSVGVAAPWKDRVLIGAHLRQEGTEWLPRYVAKLARKYRCPVLVDGRGPGAALIPDLEAAGVPLTIADTGDVLDACVGLYDRVQQGQVAHMSFDELDTAVAGAQKREVGDTGRWAWGRKASTSDVSMLEAVTLAAWHVWNRPDYDVLDSIL